MDQETISILLSAGSLVVTTFLTVMVYRFTKFSASSAAVQSINEGWSAYNCKMLEDQNVEIMNSFLTGGDAYDGTERDFHFILYLLINNISNQYYAAQAGLLKQEFSDKSSEDYFRWLFPKALYVTTLMRERGYDDELVDFFERGFRSVSKYAAYRKG